jgi:hypothetical protein
MILCALATLSLSLFLLGFTIPLIKGSSRGALNWPWASDHGKVTGTLGPLGGTDTTTMVHLGGIGSTTDPTNIGHINEQCD